MQSHYSPDRNPQSIFSQNYNTSGNQPSDDPKQKTNGMIGSQRTQNELPYNQEIVDGLQSHDNFIIKDTKNDGGIQNSKQNEQKYLNYQNIAKNQIPSERYAKQNENMTNRFMDDARQQVNKGRDNQDGINKLVQHKQQQQNKELHFNDQKNRLQSYATIKNRKDNIDDNQVVKEQQIRKQKTLNNQDSMEIKESFHISSLKKSIGDASYINKFSGNIMSRGNDEMEFDCEDMIPQKDQDEEQSFLLDDSQLMKQLKMTPVNSKQLLFNKSDHNSSKSLEEQVVVQHDSFFKIVDQDSIVVIEKYHDRCPCLNLRKVLMKFRVYIVRGSKMIVAHSVFETISILVIVANCFFLALDDPTAIEQNPIIAMSDYVFQVLYTIEMLLKIFANGFILNQGSYMRESWNILDFIIVASGYVTFMLGSGDGASGGTNINALRSFRVLRPLRTISGVEGLRVIVQALLNSIPLLRDTMLVLCFFFFIFGIAGVQLFSGIMKQRCVHIETGVPILEDDGICGSGFACPDDYFCGKTNANPIFGTCNFDNIMYSALMIFQTVTLEGWSYIQISLWKSMGVYAVAFFVPLIFIGAWFLLNLTLAVIKSRFSEEHRQQKKNKDKKKKKKNVQVKETDEEELMKQLLENESQQNDDIIIPEEIRKRKRIRIQTETFIRRVERALRQREIQDAVQKEQREEDEAKKENQGDAKKFINIFLPKLAKDINKYRSVSVDMKKEDYQIKNYGEIYNSKIASQYQTREGQSQNNEKSNGSNQSPTLFSKSPFAFLKTQNVNRAQDTIQELQEEQDKETHSQRNNEDDKKPKTKNLIMSQIFETKPLYKKNDKTLVQNWLENHFEINRANKQNGQDKVKMIGMATIYSKGFKHMKRNSLSQDPPNKKALYEKIAQNMDLFEFADNQGSDNEEESKSLLLHSFDNVSQDSTQRGIKIREIIEAGLNFDDVEQLLDSDQTSKDKVIGRKTTTDTNKSLTNFNSSPLKFDFNNKGNKVYPSRFGNQQRIQRLGTFTGQENLQEINNNDNQQKRKQQTFKERAMKFLRRNKQVKSQKSNKIIDIIKLSKSAPRPSIDMYMGQNSVVAQESCESQKSTVRAKSLQLRLFQQMQSQMKHKVRDKEIKRRRNKLFAPDLIAIGKNKEQTFKERLTKIVGKKEKHLNKGIKQYAVDYNVNKRKLIRSNSIGAITKTKKPQKNDQQNEASQFLSDEEFWREFDNVKQYNKSQKKVLIEENKVEEDDDINESSLDIDHILTKTKKRIKLNDKYNFTSQNDVLGLRNKDKFETNIEAKTLHKLFNTHNINDKQQENDHNKQKSTKEEENKKEKEKDKQKEKEKTIDPQKIQAYQKKILYQARQNFDELVLQEAIDSDDNQDSILQRLENEYNMPHRSDIHVTGTISIVINNTQHAKKIMNNNYFANIRSGSTMRSLTTINEAIQSRGNKEESNMSMQSDRAKSSESQRYVGQRKSQIRKTRSPPSAQWRSSNLQHSQTKRIQSLVTHGENKRSGLNSINSGTQYFKNIQASQKPILYTDKQILKRLNHDLKKSSNFKEVSRISKLPEEIKRTKNDNNVQILQKQPKKQVKNKNLDFENSESSLENNESSYSDFFVDRDMQFQEEVKKAKQQAIRKPKDKIEWSGQDIMSRFDPYKARIALNALNGIRVWPFGLYGYFKRGRTTLKNIMRTSLIENFLILCVAVNTITLAMDHYQISPSESAVLGTFNKAFTIIFCFEMGLKILAIGITKYLADKMNYLDGAVVIISLVELAFLNGGGALSAFRTVRIFRTFRVLRVARLLRSMKSMMNIISVIQRSIESFMYLAILLLLFLFIYTLLGMQLFGGTFNFPEGVPINNFDSFSSAFVTSFILLTMENWNLILYSCMRSGVNFIIVQLYLISWIFIGNYMLLNLFLSILLDSFTSVEEEDHETAEKLKQKEKEQREDLMRKSGEEMINEIYQMQNSNMQELNTNKNKKNSKKKKKKKKKDPNKEQQNLLDESIDVDFENLSMYQEQKQQIRDPFEGLCHISYYVFKRNNKLRMLCNRIASHGKFETTILIIIVFSSFKLIYDTYLTGLPDDNMSAIVSHNLDFFFTIFFTFESLIKSINQGLIFDQNSYLRETWNQLDFFIVITSLIDMSFASVNLPIIKILRLLRILRPLRFISHNSSMKNIIVAILQSLGAIFNVGIVISMVFLMFAILGVNLFGGKLFYCDKDTYMTKSQKVCQQIGGNWLNYDHNFDNVPKGMMTLFILSNQEGWPDILNHFTQISGVEQGPKVGSSAGNAYFFVLFLCIGNFFLLNLFVGVLFMHFEAAQRDEIESLMLDKDEVKWLDMMKMIVATRPEIRETPKSKFRKWIFEKTQPETKFDIAIMICIVLNMIVMAINFEGQPKIYTKALDMVNYFFTAIFAIEAILKLIASGFSYFSAGWNKFDFFVVLASFIDIAMGQLQGNSLKFLRVGPQLARVLRVLRVSRLFRLLNKYRGLQALLQTIMFSLPALLNVLALLILVFFIYAVLGCYLFNGITEGSIINEYMNFNNFGNAMLILFRMSTGEDWPTIMYDTMRTGPDCIPGKTCGTSISPLFFFTFQVVQCYVMLNLFVLVILQQFENYYLPEDNILQNFRDDLRYFKKNWNKYSANYLGLKISQFDLTYFFRELEGRLGYSASDSNNVIMRNIVKMNLESDEEGFIYFNELLYKAMKRKYGFERTRKKAIVEQEYQIMLKLKQIKDKMMQKSRKEERAKVAQVNPFLAIMFKSLSFKAWVKRYSKLLHYQQRIIIEKYQKQRSEEQYNDIEREDSDSDISRSDSQEYEYEIIEDVSVIDEDEVMESEMLSDDEEDEEPTEKDSLQKQNQEQSQESLVKSNVEGTENVFKIQLKKTMKDFDDSSIRIDEQDQQDKKQQ